MPPDWEAAEKHASANLVVKDSALSIEKDDSGLYCKCCQMPFPEDKNYYPICAGNAELWATGQGLPMFFEFIKYLIYLMIFLSIIYFLPCAFLMYKAFQEIKELQPDDDILAIFSLGAFIHHVKNDKYQYLDLESRRDQVHTVAILLAVGMTLTLIFLVWMRKKLKNFSARLDFDAYTPSDFCLMGSGINFDSFKNADMKENIKNRFKTKYNVEDIVYVNPAYRIGDFYDLLKKKDELEKCLTLAENIKKFNTNKHPEDFPRRKTGLFSSEIIFS